MKVTPKSIRTLANLCEQKGIEDMLTPLNYLRYAVLNPNVYDLNTGEACYLTNVDVRPENHIIVDTRAINDEPKFYHFVTPPPTTPMILVNN